MSEDPLVPPQPPETPAGRPGRRHMPAEARRQQILEAALVCFGEKGFHASTMDDLVRASGLSKGSLYWHFKSKDEVFLALFDAFSAELYGEWDDIAESGTDKLALLRREYEASLRRFAEERIILLAWAEFLAHPAARDLMRESYATARDKIRALIEAGRANGSICEGPPALGVASTFVATLEGIFLQWLVDPDFDLEGHADISWQLLEKGLRP